MSDDVLARESGDPSGSERPFLFILKKRIFRRLGNVQCPVRGSSGSLTGDNLRKQLKLNHFWNYSRIFKLE